MASTGQTYAFVADLPLQIESYTLEPLSAPMGPDRVRRTTVIRLSGAGEEGIGEDATPIEEDQVAFQEAPPTLPVVGDWTVDSFSAHLATLDLYPKPPAHDQLRSFRRWGFESAALDLALRQADRSLADVLGREVRPLTFVNSIHLPTRRASIRSARGSSCSQRCGSSSIRRPTGTSG
jgi:L-alanine-DL-glutamate epimerase-like enolase superfamily enzyme